MPTTDLPAEAPGAPGSLPPTQEYGVSGAVAPPPRNGGNTPTPRNGGNTPLPRAWPKAHPNRRGAVSTSPRSRSRASSAD
eukprot:13243524-Heterocapsa_arctica.AAC.1